MLHNENIQLGIVQKFEISMFFFTFYQLKPRIYDYMLIFVFTLGQ